MQKTDKEVLELCQSWFEDIMERSEKLTSGNVAHGRAAIRGVAKNYAEFVAEHLKERWEPSKEQITWLYRAADDASKDSRMKQILNELLSDLKKLRKE